MQNSFIVKNICRFECKTDYFKGEITLLVQILKILKPNRTTRQTELQKQQTHSEEPVSSNNILIATGSMSREPRTTYNDQRTTINVRQSSCETFHHPLPHFTFIPTFTPTFIPNPNSSSMFPVSRILSLGSSACSSMASTWLANVTSIK